MENVIFFFKNFYRLLKAMYSVDDIYWKANLTHKTNSNIHPTAKLFDHYNISDSEIGERTAIGRNAFISLTKIGKYCSIGPNLLCGWGIHPTNGISTSPIFYSNKKQYGLSYCIDNKIEERRPIEIGNDVFIGSNVTILDGVTIGNGAVIGAGAVVTKDIPAYAIAVGCPINIIRYRFDEKIISELEATEWWNFDPSKIQLVESYFFNPEAFIEKIKQTKSEKP